MASKKSKSELSRLEPPGERSPDTDAIIVTEVACGNVKAEALARYRDAILVRHEQATNSAIESLMRRVQCGEYLAEAKGLIDHGLWKNWLLENFSAETGLTVRTAQRYMEDFQLYRSFLAKLHGSEPCAVASGSLSESELLLTYCQEAILTTQPKVTNQNDPNSWISPQPVLTAVKQTLGEISCDPCAANLPQAVPIARTQYTLDDDGLADGNPWIGSVWIAPGHQGDFSPWCHKAMAEFQAGNLDRAILCLPVTPLNLPQQLCQFPVAITRVPLTVGYLRGEKIKTRKLSLPSLFVYVAQRPDIRQFAAAFRDIAVVFVSAESDLPAKPMAPEHAKPSGARPDPDVSHDSSAD